MTRKIWERRSTESLYSPKNSAFHKREKRASWLRYQPCWLNTVSPQGQVSGQTKEHFLQSWFHSKQSLGKKKSETHYSSTLRTSIWGPQDYTEQKPDVFNSTVEKQNLGGFMGPCLYYWQNKIKKRPSALIFFKLDLPYEGNPPATSGWSENCFLCSLVHSETKPKKNNYLSLTGNQQICFFFFVFCLVIEQCYRISGLWKELKSGG